MSQSSDTSSGLGGLFFSAGGPNENSIQWEFQDPNSSDQDNDLEPEEVDLDNYTNKHFMQVYEKCKPVIRETPLVYVPSDCFPHIQPQVNFELYFKLETCQIGSSVQARSAAAQLCGCCKSSKDAPDQTMEDEEDELLSSTPGSQIIPPENRCLVAVCGSTGNFGISFALLCNKLDQAFKMVMPLTSPGDKIRFIKSNNGTIKFAPSTEVMDDVEFWGNDPGHFVCSPMNSDRGLLGLGGVMHEICHVMSPDIVVTPSEGGPIVAASSTVARNLGLLNTKVFGVEPEGAPAMFYSRSEEQYTILQAASCTNDPQLALTRPCSIAYDLCRQTGSRHVLVSEHSVNEARKALFRIGLATDFSGAVGFAALNENKIPIAEGAKVVVVLTSGNFLGSKFTF